MRQYARFLKCDLHMHTPADASWLDKGTQIKPGTGSREREDAIRAYLERCYDEKLQVIALTDHNFTPSIGESLLEQFQVLNEEIARHRDCSPIVIFPGFEVECHVGKGCHVICLFDPLTSVTAVEDAASKILPVTRFEDGVPQHSNMRLQDLIDIVQGKFDGILIPAHSDRAKGLLAKETADHFLREDEFANPDLYAVEIPKPLDEITPDSFMRRVLENHEPGYRRLRRIACVLSSDAKMINPQTTDPKNHIGFRHTWIKMSRPSVEGLRQAFLAPESHIRFDDADPGLAYAYPRIDSVQFDGGFLSVPRLFLSPNLNCIIGGRGAGKSAMTDALRAAANRVGEEMPESVRQDVEHRLASTTAAADIEVRIVTDSGPYLLRLADGSSAVFTDAGDERDDLDIRSLLPATFLSQGEIDKLAYEPQKVALLLDDFVRDDLNNIRVAKMTLRSRIGQLEQKIEETEGLCANKAEVATRISQLEAQLEKCEAVATELAHWHNVEGVAAALARVEVDAKDILGFLTESEAHIVQLQTQHGTPDVPPAERDEGITRGLSLLEQAQSAVDGARRAVADAHARLQDALFSESSEFRQRLSSEWAVYFLSQQEDYEARKQELAQEGVDPDAYEAIRKLLEQNRAILHTILEHEKEIATLVSEREGLLAQLHSQWAAETKCRQSKAQQINADQQDVLRVAVTHQSDVGDFAQRLSALGIIKDRRKISEDDIMDVLKQLRQDAPDAPLAVSLPQAVRDLRNDAPNPFATLWNERKTTALLDWFGERALWAIELVETRDEVTVEVKPLLAEWQDVARVSAGQRGLALVGLLLSQGRGPLVVDQPEEGLDNEGVYSQLVPLLRAQKEKRQLIVVTHNANVPVNADAEMIMALHATDSREHRLVGCLKTYETRGQASEAVGALDAPPARRAVVDIMEGSEDAFARRRAKYGY